MGQRMQGPQCQVRNWFTDTIDPGTNALMAHRSPGPTGHRRHHHPKPQRPTLPVLIFDKDTIMEFLRSVARSKVLAHHVVAIWKEDPKASTTLHLYYWVASHLAHTHRQPGVLTLSWGDESKINGEVDKEARSLYELFVERASRGAASVVEFAEEQERSRERNIGTVEAVCKEVKEINKEFREDIVLLPLASLIVTKCAATMIFKTAGALVEAPAVFAKELGLFLFDMGYDVTVTFITNWKFARDAGAVLVAGWKAVKEALTDGAQKASEKLGEKAADKAESKLVEHGDKLAQSYFDKLVGKAEEELTKRAAANRALLNRTHLAWAAARGAKRVISNGVKLLWLVRNITKAATDAKEELDELDYFDIVRDRLR